MSLINMVVLRMLVERQMTTLINVLVLQLLLVGIRRFSRSAR